MAVLRACVDAAPDLDLELGTIYAINERGMVNHGAATGGLPDGAGEFRNDWICLSILNSQGRLQRTGFFDLEDIEGALARFEELT